MTEKERIQDTEAWPNWPRLPVKHPQNPGIPEFGFIHSRDVDDDGAITLYKGNFFGGETAHETVKFDSLDDMLKAGWVGD